MRGHTVANLAAVEGIAQDGPVFLKAQEAYIGHLGTIPDTWRGYTEVYSRTEFVLRVYDQYLKVKVADPDRAKPINIRYTGTQAYSIVEGYERIKAGLRLYRFADNPQQSRATLTSTFAAISPLFSDAAQVKQCLPTTSLSTWAGLDTM